MLKTIERIKKIKELERLIELQKLEEVKFEISTLKEKQKEYRKLMEEAFKNFRGVETFQTLTFLRQGLKELQRKIEEKQKLLKEREERVKQLQLENKVLTMFVERKKAELAKEEEKAEERRNATDYLLRQTYGKFGKFFVLLFLILMPAFGGETKEPPYADKLLKPYLEEMDKTFQQLAQKLLKSFQKLEEKEKQLEEKKKFILQKEKELEKLLEEAKNWEQKENLERAKKVKKLLEIITKADPDSAGEILSQTDPQIAAEVLINLPNVRKAGEILSSMEPEKGAKVIEVLLKRKKEAKATVVRKKIEGILRYVEGQNL